MRLRSNGPITFEPCRVGGAEAWRISSRSRGGEIFSRTAFRVDPGGRSANPNFRPCVTTRRPRGSRVFFALCAEPSQKGYVAEEDSDKGRRAIRCRVGADLAYVCLPSMTVPSVRCSVLSASISCSTSHDGLDQILIQGVPAPGRISAVRREIRL